VRDILHVLRRRNSGIPIVLYPTAVQGAAAVSGIVEALRTANARAECDVLIVARGGGSLEDLWAFNEEAVVRAICASAIPIVTGVGHEIDFTLADFAADVRAPTPSAAAELCVVEASDALRQLKVIEQRLSRHMLLHLRHLNVRIQHLSQRLVHPGRRIEQYHQRLDELARRLPQALHHHIALYRVRLNHAHALLQTMNPRTRLALLKQRVEYLRQRLPQSLQTLLTRLQSRVTIAAQTLDAVSPLATLERGYAIVSADDGRIVRRAANIARGSKISVRLRDGRIQSTVDEVVPEAEIGDSPQF
jgi:exodeoxyribonuclease VII large subunit